MQSLTITNIQFMMGFDVAWKGWVLSKGLSVGFQSSATGIIKVHRHILTSQDKVSREQEMKWNRVNEEWFTIAKSIIESDSVDNDLITIPRTYGRQ